VLDRFSETTKLVVSNAREVAESLKHSEVTTEHLLRAIIGLPSCLAWKFILDTRAPLEIIKRELDSALVPVDAETVRISGFDEFFRKAVEKAYVYTEQLNFKWINTALILLGILESGSKVASSVLNSAGLESASLIEKIKKTGEVSGSDEQAGNLSQLDVDLMELSRKFSDNLNKVLNHACELSKSYSHPETNFYHLLLSMVFLGVRNVIDLAPLDVSAFDLEKLKEHVAPKLVPEIKSTEKYMLFSTEVVKTLSIAVQEAYQMNLDQVDLLPLLLAMVIANPSETKIGINTDYSELRYLILSQPGIQAKSDSEGKTRPLPVFNKSNPTPQISLRRYNADKGAVITIPQKLAEEWGVLALNVSQQTITVAMVDPGNTDVIEKLRELTGLEVAVIKTEERELKAAFRMNY
jgi:ATP-dependent Clp protease ATP-binding subunit ClpA